MTLCHPSDVITMLTELPRGRRHLVALAGPPGAGKSTLVDFLLAGVNSDQPGRAAILAMDGYHFDDRILSARGTLARKGAPDTFDVGGLAAMLDRLRANTEDEIAVPIFDRSIETARAGAAVIPRTAEIVLVEGNYLLLDQMPWSGLASRFDMRLMIHVPQDVLQHRLEARWRGLGLPEAETLAKVQGNDLPNGIFVQDHSVDADALIVGTADLGPV